MNGSGSTRQRFSFTVVAETPVLQGGASPPWAGSSAGEKLFVVRPTAIRGLMHTFARALIGPYLGGDCAQTKKAELLLLGAPGGTVRGGDRNEQIGNTFKVIVEPSTDNSRDSFDNTPNRGSERGQTEGWAVDSKTIIRIIPRPAAVTKDALLPQTLAAVLWAGLSFGAVGKRCRRGYGSLRVTDAEGPGEENNDLPVFAEPPKDIGALAQSLAKGLSVARRSVSAWLGEQHGFEISQPPTCNNPRKFWQICGAEDSYLGALNGAENSDHEAMSRLMTAASNQKKAASDQNAARGQPDSEPDLFDEAVGSIKRGGKKRLASPLWVRYYRVRQEGQDYWVPLATFSPVHEDRTLVDNILQSIGAENRTLAVVASEAS